jgi:Protein of unknown function (DUF2911)
MKKQAAKIALFAIAIALATVPTQAQQDKAKRPSPPETASCSFADGKAIKVDYSSPRAKGRKIFGNLVPNGQVWRAGANESTALHTDVNLAVGGKAVPAGNYTIFAIPNLDKWTLIISKKTGEWGTDYPGEANDLARVDMKVTPLAAPLENFTISFAKEGDTCTMRMEWESTRASVEMAKK